MCYRPISVPNPNFHKGSYVSEFGSISEVPRHLTPSTYFIDVPCGKCAECRASYYNSILQRSLVESLTSYMFFVTLTYDDKHIPSLVLPDGHRVFYTDYRDVQNLFKRFRRHQYLDRDFRYLCALEYGDTYSRPHVHLILFVSKCTGDTPETPLFIERTLFNYLKCCWAINVGSLRNPKYEQLFTLTSKVIPSGIKTNYFVQYVKPDNPNPQQLSSDNSDSYVKTIRYLLGYVNKGSAFDDTIQFYLDTISDDLLKFRLQTILRSKFRYSKGLGCGFNVSTGTKVYIPRISIRSSLNTLSFSTFVDSLPVEFSVFTQLYPDLLQDVQHFISAAEFSRYPTLQDFVDNISSVEHFLSYCVVLRYFPNYFSRIYKMYYKESRLSNPKISYFFDFVHSDYKYKKAKHISFESTISCKAYEYVRRGVDEALSAGVPFLAFKTHQGYTSLCKFYRERVCTIDDYKFLYHRLGVSTYEEWKALFEGQYSLRKANISNANRFTHSLSENNILRFQKSSLFFNRDLKDIDLYSIIVTNRKCKKPF